MLRLEAVVARVPRPVSGGGDNRLERAPLAERLRLSPRLLEGEVLVGVARHEEHLRVRLRLRLRLLGLGFGFGSGFGLGSGSGLGLGRLGADSSQAVGEIGRATRRVGLAPRMDLREESVSK